MLYVSCWQFNSVNQQRQRQTAISQMIDGQDDTWSPAEMSVARRRPWSVAADCSTPSLQRQETRGHRELIDGLMGPTSSKSRQSADGDEQQPLMSAVSQKQFPPLNSVTFGECSAVYDTECIPSE